jgi:hypothetical protein
MEVPGVIEVFERDSATKYVTIEEAIVTDEIRRATGCDWVPRRPRGSVKTGEPGRRLTLRGPSR